MWPSLRTPASMRLAGFLGGTPADLVNVTGWDRIHQRYAGPRARTNPFS